MSDAAQVQRFRDEVAERHGTDKIHLLFNNAGISGGGSMIAHCRDEWERTFNICWGGVYHCTRAFLPMLQSADEGHIVNTSSANGFWASIGPCVPPHRVEREEITVNGFTEEFISTCSSPRPRQVLSHQCKVSSEPQSPSTHVRSGALRRADVPNRVRHS